MKVVLGLHVSDQLVEVGQVEVIAVLHDDEDAVDWVNKWLEVRSIGMRIPAIIREEYFDDTTHQRTGVGAYVWLVKRDSISSARIERES